jgi:HEAT repeat protein
MRRHRRIRTAAASACLVSAAVLAAELSSDDGQALAQGAAAGAVDTKAMVQKIGSADPAQIAAGLAEAKDAADQAKGAAPAIEALLARGTTIPLAQAGIEALGAIRQSSSSAVIAPYLSHRSSDLRRAAVRALADTRGPAAIEAFRAGLRSSDGMVRGFSATGLGNLGAREALADLFTALERNVTESAAAIGQLCQGEECKKFAGYLGKVGFDVMTSGFDLILFRDKPLPEKDQLNLVGLIRELGTPEAGQYLADVQGRWPTHYSQKVKQAIDQAVSSIPGASAGGEDS